MSGTGTGTGAGAGVAEARVEGSVKNRYALITTLPSTLSIKRKKINWSADLDVMFVMAFLKAEYVRALELAIFSALGFYSEALSIRAPDSMQDLMSMGASGEQSLHIRDLGYHLYEIDASKPGAAPLLNFLLVGINHQEAAYIEKAKAIHRATGYLPKIIKLDFKFAGGDTVYVPRTTAHKGQLLIGAYWRLEVENFRDRTERLRRMQEEILPKLGAALKFIDIEVSFLACQSNDLYYHLDTYIHVLEAERVMLVLNMHILELESANLLQRLAETQGFRLMDLNYNIFQDMRIPEDLGLSALSSYRKKFNKIRVAYFEKDSPKYRGLYPDSCPPPFINLLSSPGCFDVFSAPISVRLAEHIERKLKEIDPRYRLIAQHSVNPRSKFYDSGLAASVLEHLASRGYKIQPEKIDKPYFPQWMSATCSDVRLISYFLTREEKVIVDGDVHAVYLDSAARSEDREDRCGLTVGPGIREGGIHCTALLYQRLRECVNPHEAPLQEKLAIGSKTSNSNTVFFWSRERALSEARRDSLSLGLE